MLSSGHDRAVKLKVAEFTYKDLHKFEPTDIPEQSGKLHRKSCPPLAEQLLVVNGYGGRGDNFSSRNKVIFSRV